MRNRYLLAFFVLFLSAPLHLEASSQEITSDTTWSGNQSISSQITVKPGVTLIIEKGSKISFSNEAYLNVEGKLDIRGTVLEPVTIQPQNDGDFYFIQSVNNGDININNTDISGGGKVTSYPTDPDTGVTPVDTYYGALSVSGEGKVNVQATNFHNNTVAVLVQMTNVSNGRLSVERSSFEGNISYDVVNQNSQIRPDFKWNWWDDVDGPEASKIFGQLDTEFFRNKKEFKDPVIIIPGILGSHEVGGGLVIDPIFHVYDNLIATFVEAGYSQGTELVTFPYEWRNSNINNAELLRQKINETVISNNWPKVDVVAHSMGGLLARQYIESDQYTNDIDQLITLGTPHNGSPQSYLTWEAGELGLKFSDFILKIVLQQEAEENGFNSLFEYIRNPLDPIVSVNELLPVYSYLFEANSNNNLRPYPNNYPFNDFLGNLNESLKVEKLKKVEFVNIVGNLEESSTITGFKTIDPTMLPLWEHGYPKSYDVIGTDRGLEKGAGDGTVPLESATYLSSNYLKEIDSSHNNLPTEAQKDVIEYLIGDRPESEVRDTGPIDQLLGIFIFSPVDVQIVSPSGKKIGKNFVNGNSYNQIPGAFYTGFETENEFITIPNPEEGEYKIFTEGTGDGNYRIESVLIKDNGSGNDASESKVTFTGTVTLGEENEEAIELFDDTVTPKADEDTEVPIITIQSPQEKEYSSDKQLPVAYSVIDNISLPENVTKQVLLDTEEHNGNTLDLSLLSLGSHQLKIIATDEAENSASKSVEFKSKATFSSLRKNIDHYFSISLIKKRSTALDLKQDVTLLELLKVAVVELEKSNLPSKIKSLLLTKAKAELASKKRAFLNKLIKLETNQEIDSKAKERIVESINVLTP